MRVILKLEDVMAGYNTEQKKMLLDLLEKNNEKRYTIETLIAELRDVYGESAPGKSTVYRLMTRLVDDGRVRRLVKGHGRHFEYQGMKGDACCHHLHLKCMSCGRLFHLDEGISAELLEKIRGVSEFSVNEAETVLFGKCNTCD